MATSWNGNYVPGASDQWNLIADWQKHAALNNRVIPVNSQAQRDSLIDSAPDGKIPEGTIVLRLDKSAKSLVLDHFVNGGWVDGRRTPVSAAGLATVTPSAANTPTSVDVAFPVGLFSESPAVTLTPNTAFPGSSVTGVAATDVTKDGFKLWLTRVSTASTNCFWSATQYT